MNDELLDVVDDSDSVIGQASRGEVHQRNLKHRAVHILVFSNSGKIFLQKRSSLKDRHPGVWDSSASGHLDAGEKYDVAAIRELKEELGFSPKTPLKPLFKLEASDATGQEFVWVYRCDSDGPFNLNKEEIEKGDWFSPAELDKWLEKRPQDFAPSFPIIWRRWQRAEK